MNTHRSYIRASKYHFPVKQTVPLLSRRLIAGLGKKRGKVTPEHFVIPESKNVTKDSGGPVRGWDRTGTIQTPLKVVTIRVPNTSIMLKPIRS